MPGLIHTIPVDRINQHSDFFDSWGTPGPELSDTGEYCAVTHFDDPFHKRKKQLDVHFNTNDDDHDSVNEFIENVGYNQKYYVTTPCQVNSNTPDSEFSDFAIEFRNRSELADSGKVRFEDTESIFSEFGSDTRSEIDIDSNIAISVKSVGSSLRTGLRNDFTELFDSLELNTCPIRPVKSEDIGQIYVRRKLEDDETQSFIDQDYLNNSYDLECQSDGISDEKENISAIRGQETTMSKEARFAVIETLHDMKMKGNQDKVNSEIRNKGVSAQTRLQNNRKMYNRYKTMAETKNLFIERDERKNNGPVNQRESISRYKSFDSEGETAADEYSSAFSSELNTKYTDDSSSAEDMQVKKKGKLLPSININRKSAKRLNSAATKFHTLEKAKMTNYRIPGIGKFDIVTSPDDFRITPPGFDSRYEPQPIIYKEEREPPPADVQKKSIQKCRKWLKNVHLSPLSSLQPAHK